MKIVQPKIMATLNDDNVITLEKDFVELYYKEKEENWKLIRERDKLTLTSRAIIWIEWNDDKTFSGQFEDIKLNRSLIMSPFSADYTWQTTVVTEIIEQREDYFKFKTNNSTYELFKINE